jgi:hypothetical protein
LGHARFSSADASVNDHSFATGDLIEVKFRLVGENIGERGRIDVERSATAGANRQVDLRWRRYFHSFCSAALAAQLCLTLEAGNGGARPAGNRTDVKRSQ